MPVPTRRLDDLDRLALRLARVLQATYPQLLQKAFPLGELEARLVPLQEVRRELSRDGADCYELALLRLVTGERAYLVTPEEVQVTARRALASAAPSAGAIRAHAAQAVRVGDGLVQLLATLGAPTEYGSVVVPAARTPALSLLGRDGPARGRAACGCRYCGGGLPEGRMVSYCPHCGLDLTVQHCPACSATLELDWRFCVSCGRGVEGPVAAPVVGAVA